MPQDDFFAFITDLVRPIGTYLYGRRLYDAMAVWETDPTLAAQSKLRADATLQEANKVVYSTTMDAVSTAKTRLEHNFDPASVRDTKASATSDLTVGGALLAAYALKAGLVDECHLFIHPVLLGGGKPALPSGYPRPSSSCWTIADSATVSCTSATASRPERPRVFLGALASGWREAPALSLGRPRIERHAARWPPAGSQPT